MYVHTIIRMFALVLIYLCMYICRCLILVIFMQTNRKVFIELLLNNFWMESMDDWQFKRSKKKVHKLIDDNFFS